MGLHHLAKAAAALSRRKPKDWYDIAFVLLHNDAGGPVAAARLVKERFGGELVAVRTALDDLLAKGGGRPTADRGGGSPAFSASAGRSSR